MSTRLVYESTSTSPAVAVSSTLRAAVNEMSLAAESIVTPVAASMSTTSAVADSTSLLAPVTATSCSTELISTPV